MPLRRHVLHALAAGLLGARPAAAQAPPGVVRASAVKAAFLYKFGSFVEWPPGSFAGTQSPLAIGIWGDDDVFRELEQISAGRLVEGRPVRVLRVQDAESLPRVHILFCGGTREARVRELLAAARGPVLTVADGPAGARVGAVLHFTEDEGRVRFNASLTAAARRGLKLSAKLLAVAQQVEGRTP